MEETRQYRAMLILAIISLIAAAIIGFTSENERLELRYGFFAFIESIKFKTDLQLFSYLISIIGFYRAYNLFTKKIVPHMESLQNMRTKLINYIKNVNFIHLKEYDNINSDDLMLIDDLNLRSEEAKKMYQTERSLTQRVDMICDIVKIIEDKSNEN